MIQSSSGDQKYVWTLHARLKMKYYGLSESRIKRIIRFPARTEEGIVENTVAVMQPAGTKRYTEIWTMYRLVGKNRQANPKSKFLNPKRQLKLKIITAWRYPGKSPARDPIPAEVLKEIKNLL
jgi:hypothetical protein